MVQMRINRDARIAKVNLPLSGAVEGITHLQVYLSHEKSKGFSISLLGIEVKELCEGLMLFDKRHKRFMVEACPRYNAKRLEALAAAVGASIETECGDVWERITMAAAGWQGDLVRS